MRQFLFVLIFVGLSVTTTFGCECPLGTHKQNYRWAKSIFTGEAVSVGTDKISNPQVSKRDLYRVTFKVERRWKGAKSETVSVLTDSCASMCCLIKFREGQKYLVYVYKDSFVPSDCAWSAEIDSERARGNISDLSSFWFRLKADLWIF